MRSTLWSARGEEYCRFGFVILPGALPIQLLAQLQKEADRGRSALRKGEIRTGASEVDYGRIQPIRAYPGVLDWTPFSQIGRLPALRLARTTFLGRKRRAIRYMGILYETDMATARSQWHRDIRRTDSSFDDREFYHRSRDPACFCQVSIALCHDSCLRIIPGSANRPDTEAERDAIQNGRLHLRPNSADGARFAGSEARKITLSPGDAVLYRAGSWHAGVYSRDQPRANIIFRYATRADLAYYRDAARSFSQ